MSDIQEQIKIAHKKAEENDIKLLKEENEKLNLYIEFYKSIIDKAIEYIEKYKEEGMGEQWFRSSTPVSSLLNILKGDNK